MSKLGTAIVALVSKVQEPRHKKMLMALAYTLSILVGVSVFINPPNLIEGLLGSIVTNAWAALYLVGGLIGILTVAPGWWWGERLGIYAIVIGIVIYGGIILYLGQGSGVENGLPHFFALFVALPLVTYRLTDIWKLPYEPRRR